MRFQERLQVTLQERYRRLAKSNHASFDANVRYFLDWADGQPAVASILAAIARAEPELKCDEWLATVQRGRVNWPATEVGRAKVVLHTLRGIVDGTAPVRVWMVFTGTRNMNDAIRDFCNDAVEPLIEYVQERLGAESDVLYLLERYRRQVLWFDQQALYDRYEADTSNGEAVYDEHLRRFLFEQGVDYPFPQPESPSGKADIVANVDTDDPLACEVKLFGGNYGTRTSRRAFTRRSATPGTTARPTRTSSCSTSTTGPSNCPRTTRTQGGRHASRLPASPFSSSRCRQHPDRWPASQARPSP